MKCNSFELPDSFFSVTASKAFDHKLASDYGLSSQVLMQRAGESAYRYATTRWSHLRKFLIFCGPGNNGGDGFAFALTALSDRCEVLCCFIGKTQQMTSATAHYHQAFLEKGGEILSVAQGKILLTELDATVVVDAILGIGVSRELSDEIAYVVSLLNRDAYPVLSLDVPSGLLADTGSPFPIAVRATATMTFLTLKPGLCTGSGPEHCGKLVFSDLSAPTEAYQHISALAQQACYARWQKHIQPRRIDGHKGLYGKVLCVGGNQGFAGSVLLAGEAAARVGAGLVMLATHQAHANALAVSRPELIVREVNQEKTWQQPTDVMVFGPGLGQDAWAHALFADCIEHSSEKLTVVLDADGLNLLAKEPFKRKNWILTPHPKEAARLLQTSVTAVNMDRLAAAQRIRERYGGIVVLKGSGTVIATPSQVTYICTDGNPGMASGGMGDVLTGIIAGLVAQHYSDITASVLGVCLHAHAADKAQTDGRIGMLARDLMPWIRRFANPS